MTLRRFLLVAERAGAWAVTCAWAFLFGFTLYAWSSKREANSEVWFILALLAIDRAFAVFTERR